MNDLRFLKKFQLKLAAKVLTRAFEHDPIFVELFPESQTRYERLYLLMTYCLRSYMRYGEVHVTSPKIEGVSLWYLWESEIETREEIRKKELFDNWLWFRLWAALGETTERIGSIHGEQVSVRNELLPNRHWYLMMIGVDPNHQGKGFASRLIYPMLARMDKEGLPCYLDTNNERNVKIYEHIGFKLIKKYLIPGTSVLNWSMLWQRS